MILGINPHGAGSCPGCTRERKTSGTAPLFLIVLVLAGCLAPRKLKPEKYPSPEFPLPALALAEFPPLPPLPIDEFIGPLPEYTPPARTFPFHMDMVGNWVTQWK